TRWRGPPPTPSRATSSCSRRPARATTSSRTSSSAATRSAASPRSSREPYGDQAPPRTAAPRARHARAHRLRPRDGLQRDLGVRKLRALAPTLVVAALVLCAAVLVLGERVNGARRWIGFGPVAFQPSELAKLALVVWCAAYLARRPAPRTLKDLARPIGTLVGLFCLLILVEPDLGTVIIIVVMVGAMLLVSGTPLPTLGAAYGIVVGLGALAAWTSPYRRERLLTFLDPWHD